METVSESQLTAQPAPWRGRIQSAVLSKSLSTEAARGPKITNDYIIFKNTNTHRDTWRAVPVLVGTEMTEFHLQVAEKVETATVNYSTFINNVERVYPKGIFSQFSCFYLSYTVAFLSTAYPPPCFCHGPISLQGSLEYNLTSSYLISKSQQKSLLTLFSTLLKYLPLSFNWRRVWDSFTSRLVWLQSGETQQARANFRHKDALTFHLGNVDSCFGVSLFVSLAVGENKKQNSRVVHGWLWVQGRGQRQVLDKDVQFQLVECF